MTSVDAPADSRHTSADVVAGFLAVASIVLSLFAMGLGLILEVDARPARTGFVAIILALVSARLSAPLPVARAQGRPLRDAGVGRRDDARCVDRESTDLGTRGGSSRSVHAATGTTHRMSGADLSGLNAGYVAQMLEAYLDAPASVSQEWRDLFERDPAAFTGSLPGLAGLLQRDGDERGCGCDCSAPLLACSDACSCPCRGHRHSARRRARVCSGARRRAALPAAAEPEPPLADASPAVDEILLGGVAAAMALVKAYRMHGHLAARLDPLGSEPMGDPGARRVAPRPVADARAAGADPGLACSASTSRATRCSRRCRSSAPSTPARSPTRSSTSPITPSASGCGRRSNRAASGSRSRPTSARRSCTGSPRPRASSSTCAGRSSGRSSSRSRASSRSCRCSTRRSGSLPPEAHTRS